MGGGGQKSEENSILVYSLRISVFALAFSIYPLFARYPYSIVIRPSFLYFPLIISKARSALAPTPQPTPQPDGLRFFKKNLKTLEFLCSLYRDFGVLGGPGGGPGGVPGGSGGVPGGGKFPPPGGGPGGDPRKPPFF